MEENEERTLYENLEYLNETKGIIKQAIIDKGVEISADTPFREYADKISDITTGEDLEEELSAQEQVIQQMKIALENKTAGGKVKLNVYAQTTEPANKDGIWLETNKEFDKVYFDEQVKRIEVEGWDTTKTYPTISDVSSYNGHTSARVGDYIYIFSSNGSAVHKYDIINNTITENIASINPYIFSYWTGTCTDGTNIYLFGSTDVSANYKKLFKFDTTDNSISEVVTLTRHYYGAKITAIGNYIYLFGGNNTPNAVGKYNLITQEYDTLTNTPSELYMSGENSTLCNIGSIIYLFGGNNMSPKYVYKYDTSTDTYVKLTDFSFQSDTRYLISCNVGNFIYLFNIGGNYTYKYDVINDTYTKMTNYRFGGNGGNAYLYNNKIIVVGNANNNTTPGQSGAYNSIGIYALTYDSVYDYENNSVVIWDGFGKYKTQITQSADNQEGKIQTLFYDAYHYTTENGLDDTIPTYYGNGTQWVKFKN